MLVLVLLTDATAAGKHVRLWKWQARNHAHRRFINICKSSPDGESEGTLLYTHFCFPLLGANYCVVTCRGLLADWTTFLESLPPFYLVFSLLMLSGQVGYLVSVKERCQNVLMTRMCTSIKTIQTTGWVDSSILFHVMLRMTRAVMVSMRELMATTVAAGMVAGVIAVEIWKGGKNTGPTTFGDWKVSTRR